jgi:hypothetical protein
VFPTTPIALVAPEGLDLAAYVQPEQQQAHPIHVVRFDPGFFRSTETYSRLLISAAFYQTFASYEFILVHQLDVFVFRDELADWCARGYDYIGAPWFGVDWLAEAKHTWPPETRDNVVGNGGFSLRRVAPALKLLTEMPEAAEEWGGNEDQFWAFRAPACKPFKIPKLEEALAFSFEVWPERAFALNGSKLPFGCHGWAGAGTACSPSSGGLLESWGLRGLSAHRNQPYAGDPSPHRSPCRSRTVSVLRPAGMRSRPSGIQGDIDPQWPVFHTCPSRSSAPSMRTP